MSAVRRDGGRHGQPAGPRRRQNSGAVTVGATVPGVIVAAVYSVFGAFQWRATKRQADLTQRVFEETHWPYEILADVGEPTDSRVHGRLRFTVIFENQGAVPAHVTGWEIHGTLLHPEADEQPLAHEHPTHRSPGSIGPRDRWTLQLEFTGGT